jgi:glycosyltransferase involved in cell wall biosynthesis
LLQAADVLVLPSEAEGLPLVVLEAMACARPVVATAVNGTTEAVVDGVTGFLVPPRDADALARAVLRLFDDASLRDRLGKAGHRRVCEQFSVARVRHRFRELYRDLSS